MRSIVSYVLTFAAVSLFMAQIAVVSPKWCEEDPVFSVAGSEVDITTGFDLKYLSYAQSATFELQVPSNVLALVVSTPGTVPITAKVSPTLAPWSGMGSIPVIALITVKGTKSFPTSTQILGMYGSLASWTTGSANKTQKIKFSLIH